MRALVSILGSLALGLLTIFTALPVAATSGRQTLSYGFANGVNRSAFVTIWVVLKSGTVKELKTLCADGVKLGSLPGLKSGHFYFDELPATIRYRVEVKSEMRGCAGNTFTNMQKDLAVTKSGTYTIHLVYGPNTPQGDYSYALQTSVH